MQSREISVPVALLLEPSLAPSAKVLWIANLLDSTADEVKLKAQTGLSRQTLQRAMGQVKSGRHFPDGLQVKVPRNLLSDAGVGAQAKVLYGLLQTVPQFGGGEGEFTYATLNERTKLGPNTLKRALRELEAAGWVLLSQRSRLSPIQFRLENPWPTCTIEEIAAVKRRLRQRDNRGERIMKEYLSLLIDSNQFTDNARPGWLVNPLTQGLMEFDRYYMPNWAFEFHGEQHDGPTELYAQEVVDGQQLRDVIKAGICFYRGIQLVVIRAADLTLAKMSERIPAGLPRRNLKGQEELIELVEEASFEYRAASGGKA